MAASERFAVVRKVRRVWAVGSIHGEARRLAALHDAIAPRFARGDRLVYLGNYFGRGDAIVDTLDELIRFRRAVIAQPRMFAEDVVFLRGAQEEIWHKLLQLQFALNPAEVLDWMLAQGAAATIGAYGGDPRAGFAAAREGARAIARWTVALRDAMNQQPGHQALVSAIKRAAYSDDGKLLFVHAGLDPGRPLAAQGDALWWGSPGFPGRANGYGEFALIVRGAGRGQDDVRLHGGVLTVDAGCGFGGKLAAALIGADGALLDVVTA
jgi:serine/threonine protein phosphatase 1